MTIWLTSPPNLLISRTNVLLMQASGALVREISKLGGDVSQMVTSDVLAALNAASVAKLSKAS